MAVGARLSARGLAVQISHGCGSQRGAGCTAVCRKAGQDPGWDTAPVTHGTCSPAIPTLPDPKASFHSQGKEQGRRYPPRYQDKFLHTRGFLSLRIRASHPALTGMVSVKWKVPLPSIQLHWKKPPCRKLSERGTPQN